MEVSRRQMIVGGLALVVGSHVNASEPTAEVSLERIRKIAAALEALGEPLPANDGSHAALEKLLQARTLAYVTLNSHGVGLAKPGDAPPELLELGWRTFLVRVENPARLTGPLKLIGRFAIPEGDLGSGIHEPQAIGNDRPEIVRQAVDTDWNWDFEVGQWLGYRFGSALLPALTGEPVEYQLLQLYSQQGGANSTTLVIGADALRGAVGLDSKGFTTTFNCKPATTLALQIRDTDGRGTMCSLLIRDQAGRIYPAPAHRVEPELTYQPQIYRADGEVVRLPAGRYDITSARGPEYLTHQHDVTLAQEGGVLTVALERWIEPAKYNWFVGDPHVHPEGQTYSIVSKYGLTPETMARQIRGEGLAVGSILIWTSGYWYQKQFLTGHAYESSYQQPFPQLQRANNSVLTLRSTPHDADSVVRNDVEQAAFPSNMLGHPVLLKLKNHDWSGGPGIWDWPSWNLPIFQWARAQGAVAGYAHPGIDPVSTAQTELPNYTIPRLFGIGANEAVVDVANGYCDFLAGGESPPVADLNLWYHLLNCGFRLPMIGETDFTAGNARAGSLRTYVRLEQRPEGNPGYEAWVEGVKQGEVYFGDGRSHLIDFRSDRAKGNHVTLTAKVAARLEPQAFDVDAENIKLNTLRYWHIERARIGESRTVPLEVVVNGRPVQRHVINADGELREMKFTVDLQRSSWVALRILPSVHSKPVYIEVGKKPIRASRRSAQWCLDCVEVLWKRHEGRLRESERAAAFEAWEHARRIYRKIIEESATD